MHTRTFCHTRCEKFMLQADGGDPASCRSALTPGQLKRKREKNKKSKARRKAAKRAERLKGADNDNGDSGDDSGEGGEE